MMWCRKCNSEPHGHCLEEHRVCVLGDPEAGVLRLRMFLREELEQLKPEDRLRVRSDMLQAVCDETFKA